MSTPNSNTPPAENTNTASAPAAQTSKLAGLSVQERMQLAQLSKSLNGSVIITDMKKYPRKNGDGEVLSVSFRDATTGKKGSRPFDVEMEHIYIVGQPIPGKIVHQAVEAYTWQKGEETRNDDMAYIVQLGDETIQAACKACGKTYRAAGFSQETPDAGDDLSNTGGN